MKSYKRHIAGAYISSVISISLMLVLVGVSVFLIANARSVANYFKESIQLSVILKNEAGNSDAEKYSQAIKHLPYVKDTRVITKEEGTEDLKQMLGDDFLSVFESSPVPVSVNVYLKAEYVRADSLEMISKALYSESPLVEEISSKQSLVDALNANIAKISLVLGAVILMLLFISFILIGNTVRANLFAKRFTIHTMKQVGATRAFICAPFMKSALIQGLISSFVATGILALVLNFGRKSFATLFEAAGTTSFVVVTCAVFITGLAICELSTLFTTLKLISIDKDQLYY